MKLIIKCKLDIEDVDALINFFYTDGGYISHENHEGVHIALRKLEAFKKFYTQSLRSNESNESKEVNPCSDI